MPSSFIMIAGAIVVAVIILLVLSRSKNNSGSTSESTSSSTSSSASGSTSSSANNKPSSNLNTELLDNQLGYLYEIYSELCERGLPEAIYHIFIWYMPPKGIFIDVQLDGSWFLKYLKNDILTSFYTLPEGENPETWHNRHAEFPSREVSNSEINAYINDYKQRNSDKGDFLKLLVTLK